MQNIVIIITGLTRDDKIILPAHRTLSGLPRLSWQRFALTDIFLFLDKNILPDIVSANRFGVTSDRIKK